MGLTDEAASLNEGSTLPGMQNAPYLGTWVMKDKGMGSLSRTVPISRYGELDPSPTVGLRTVWED